MPPRKKQKPARRVNVVPSPGSNTSDGSVPHEVDGDGEIVSPGTQQGTQV